MDTSDKTPEHVKAAIAAGRQVPKWIAERFATDPAGFENAMRLRESAFPKTTSRGAKQ